MEIIKRGIAPSEVSMKGTCGTCKTVARAKRGELKSYSDYRESSYYTECPVCTRTMYFKEETSPTGGFNDQWGR